jgi:large subunit ribosomal protein L11
VSKPNNKQADAGLVQVKLQIPAGKANPSPPVGSALGPRGINIMEFCRQFNERSTKQFAEGTPVPVTITVKKDKSFEFTMKAPPSSYLILKQANIAKGSQTPGKNTVGKISMASIEEVAKIKMADMGIDNLESAMASIKGTAQSMGIVVEG